MSGATSHYFDVYYVMHFLFADGDKSYTSILSFVQLLQDGDLHANVLLFGEEASFRSLRKT